MSAIHDASLAFPLRTRAHRAYHLWRGRPRYQSLWRSSHSMLADTACVGSMAPGTGETPSLNIPTCIQQTDWLGTVVSTMFHLGRYARRAAHGWQLLHYRAFSRIRQP